MQNSTDHQHQNNNHNLPDLWQAVIRVLEQNIVQNQLKAWIYPLTLLNTENHKTHLQVSLSSPNDFSMSWIKDHYQTTIEKVFTQITGITCKLSLCVQQSGGPSKNSADHWNLTPPEEQKQPAQPLTDPSNLTIEKLMTKPTQERPLVIEKTIDPRYTFDNFVVGASNQFAHASAVAISQKPAQQYNPLFLYSSPGLGKTHLLHAIGNYLKQSKPSVRVGYLSAESFVNELIESIKHNKMSHFRKKFRDSYDVLLIDDIQFIAGKQKTEEEFFHTFNSLHGSKRQIVVSSDRPPKEIAGLEERIRTRFEWGLVADISIPEIETRIAILKQKAEQDDIYLPDDVCTFLATYIKSNVRELEGLLIRLQAQASLTGAEISLEMAKQELKLSIPEEGSFLTIETIQNVTSKHFNIKVQDLKSTNRSKKIATARQLSMYLIRKYTGLGFKDIGHYFGGKDHTTVMYACRKIEKGCETNPETIELVEALQNQL